jgi:hypothetical protein
MIKGSHRNRVLSPLYAAPLRKAHLLLLTTTLGSSRRLLPTLWPMPHADAYEESAIVWLSGGFAVYDDACDHAMGACEAWML